MMKRIIKDENENCTKVPKSGRHSSQPVLLFLPDLGRYSGKFGQGRVQREH
jgi:hypothetical protein